MVGAVRWSVVPCQAPARRRGPAAGLLVALVVAAGAFVPACGLVNRAAACPSLATVEDIDAGRFGDCDRDGPRDGLGPRRVRACIPLLESVAAASNWEGGPRQESIPCTWAIEPGHGDPGGLVVPEGYELFTNPGNTLMYTGPDPGHSGGRCILTIDQFPGLPGFTLSVQCYDPATEPAS